MAEVAIGIVKDKLVSLVAEEVQLLAKVPTEFKEISKQLEELHSLLKDADKKAEDEGDNFRGGVKTWVKDLREVAFHIEDLVTEYVYHEEEESPDFPQNGFPKCLGEIPSFLIFWCSRLIQRHDLGWKIRHVKVRFNKIHQQGKNDGFINTIQDGSTRIAALNADPSNVVRSRLHQLLENEHEAFRSARDELVQWLDTSSACTIIPVVGTGGSGKTTLAEEVYNYVQGRFDCHAWVEVHKPYRVEEILRTLITELYELNKASVPGSIQTMNEKKLVHTLKEFLKEKKYLVIFDDVWKEDFWAGIGQAFIKEHIGGRIMITTRHVKVAAYCERTSFVRTYEVKELPTKEARELFYKKAFRPDGSCPEELEIISGEIIERFKGLPLALVTIAGILSAKDKNIEVWQEFEKSLGSELENDVGLQNLMQILLLGYDELPYYLKPCLLYFGMFPRSHSIRNGRLIKQWIAQGFVKAERGKTVEKVAQKYMDELIGRSLVKATSVDVTGKAKKCRVYELLHETILKKMEEISFCQVIQGSPSDQSGLRGITRRLSIKSNRSIDDSHSHSAVFIPQREELSHIHSVIVCHEDKTIGSVVLKFPRNFRFLKVLDFEDAPNLDKLPDDIGKLFDLRYLSVRRTKVKILPRSIEKLKYLETLDLRESFVYEIPADIVNKLCKLKYLYAEPNPDLKKECFPGGLCGIEVQGKIDGLKELQKLFFVRADGTAADLLFDDLSGFTKLRSLGIIGLRYKDGRRLFGCTAKMAKLKSLTVESTSENEFIDLGHMSSPPTKLKRLNLRGRLKNLPEWFLQLQKLVKIRLNYSQLEVDPLDVLQTMRNLSELSIRYNAYIGEQLRFRKGVFPKLKRLYLIDLKKLRSLVVEKTALAELEELHIGQCPQMSEVPTGLEHLQKLKTLVFDSVKDASFIYFQDFESVSRVPLVKFSYVDDGKKEWINLRNLREFQGKS
ncbi:hypothetical protein TIFTF001_034233 [Ficus carica]|uniref:Uncharacterized protein n=1 Tax=Ficus carica TaxID=3494 RepID=A0AA88J891_FICCA|nr:hypothetical protein TIFTF001_034233 [Ficus carica]